MAFHLNGYSNFHDDNQDWIISQVKSIEDAEANTAESASEAAASAEAAQLSAEASQLSAEASQASANDSQQSAEASAMSEASAKNYAEHIADPVSGIVTDWLEDNITPTTPAVDASLTISGAAADAKAAGDRIGAIETALNKQEIITQNLFHGELQNNKSWNCWTSTVNIQDTNDYAAGEVNLPTDTAHVSSNSYWMNNSFSAFVDDNNNKIGLVRDYVTSDPGFIYSVPEGATKIRFSFNAADPTLQTAIQLYGIVIVADSINLINKGINEYPYTDRTLFFADNLLMSEYDNETLSDILKSKTFTVSKTGTGDFSSLVSAINHVNDNNIMDAVLYIGEGVWDIADELGAAYMESVTSNPATWGLVLKNRIKLVGSSNSVIKCFYTGTRQETHEYFSVFNSGKYGFTLENINIEDDNIRYSVHDDRGGNSFNEIYNNKYLGCSMKHTNGMYSDCIGGGLGINGYIEIKDCYFEGDNGLDRLVYYHGNNYGGETDAKCKIIVTGNFFANDGTFKLTKYGDSLKVSTAYVSNNSFGSEPELNAGSYAPNNNMQMIEWNNVIR